MTSLPSERLQAYFPFDEHLLEQIDQAAADQNAMSFRELADSYRIAEGIRTAHPFGDKRTLEYLYLEPAHDYDKSHVRVLYNNMAMPVDASIAMRAMRLFAASPDRPLVVVGNPAATGVQTNIPSRQSLGLLRHGGFSVLAEPSLRHLSAQNVRSIDVMGYSLGADIAAGAAQVAVRYDLVTRRAVWAEPVQLRRPGVIRLANQFFEAGKTLDSYVKQTESRPLFEARRLADTGLARYIGGLLRPSNRAAIYALATSTFGDRAGNAMAQNPTLTAEMIRGSLSEVCDSTVARNTYYGLADRFHTSIGSTVMSGMHHAGCDDIDLHAAMMLQALEH